MQADRQLRLSDLLGTALALRQRENPDEFEQAVMGLAEARCRGASPSAVVLNRLGARSWGGIGLTGAMVIGLGLMGGGEAARTEARTPTPRTWQEIEAARELEQQRGNSAAFAGVPDMRRIKPGTGTDDADPLKSGVTEPAPASANSDAANSGQSTADHMATSQDGTGAGDATSASKGGEHSKTNPLAGGAGHTDSGGNTHAGGGGAAATGGKRRQWDRREHDRERQPRSAPTSAGVARGRMGWGSGGGARGDPEWGGARCPT